MLHPDFGGDAKRVLKALGRSLAIGLGSESEELDQSVARYPIGGTRQDPLRAELKKVAPHAFRAPARTAAPAIPSQARAKANPIRRSAVKAAAADNSADNWRAF
jgi:methyl-accepting chemotaxis protein